MSDENLYLYDPESEQIFEVTQNIRVGRSDSNDLAIKDQSISSKHASLILKEGELFVKDLNSFNSTYINGNECEPEVLYKLKAKDVVQFGDKVFYFNSTEANQEYLELPGITGSISIGSEKTGHKIVHDYYDPILEQKKQKKAFSLKNLREHKEEIEKLHQELDAAKVEYKKTKDFKKHIKAKNKEMEEFNSYLETKSYSDETEVKAIIYSIEEVSERIEQDKSKLQEKIDILKNQLADLDEEMQSLDQEKDKNNYMISELNKDIEIINGRDALIEEIKQLKKTAEEFNEETFQAQINEIKSKIKVKEKQYKSAQEKYANSRFGNNKSLFGKKAS